MPIGLRLNYDAARVRGETPRSKDAGQARRLLALAAVYQGASRTKVARIGGVTLADRPRLSAELQRRSPSGLIDRIAPGRPPRLNARHRTALSAALESGPIPTVHGVVRWRDHRSMQWLWDEFEVRIATQTLSRELRGMDYRKLGPAGPSRADGGRRGALN